MHLVVFDWDQTLWNSWPLHRETVWHTADRLGIPRPSVKSMLSYPSGVVENHLEQLFGRPSEEFLQTYLGFYYANRAWLSRSVPGVEGMLRTLKQRGYHLALLSNKLRRHGEWDLEHSGLGRFIELAVFREEGETLKPRPEPLLAILRHFHVPWQEAILAGDSAIDIQCAKNARVASAAALWACLDPGVLLQEEPDHVWERVEEATAALDLVGKSP
ncbi:MAG: HAD family hydrolase [Dehalococcoidia bacterium]